MENLTYGISFNCSDSRKMGIIKETSSGALHGRTYSGSYANWYCVGRTGRCQEAQGCKNKEWKVYQIQKRERDKKEMSL